jgi:hypothetical protein
VLSNLTVIHRMIYTFQEAKRLEDAQLRLAKEHVERRAQIRCRAAACRRLKRILNCLCKVIEAGVFRIWHTVVVAWEVEFTDEFRDWWNSLSEEQQDDVAYSVRHLMELGPALGFPHSSKVVSSRYPQMRELRTQSAGRPLRTLYAFDPLRSAILLIGGDKTGEDRWYEKFVPIADRLFERHLLEIKKEGSI